MHTSTRSRTTRRLVGGVLALGFLAAACGSSDDSSGDGAVAAPEATAGVVEPSDVTSAPEAPSTDARAGSDAAPAPTDAAVVVPEALQFTAPLVGGGEFDGAAVADKPTVFWFWAPT